MLSCVAESLIYWVVIKPFNFIVNRSVVMATLAEISAMIDEVMSSVEAVDTGLDGVAALIANLKAGQVTQEQIDALGVKVEALKAKSAAIVVEAEGLKA